jgi:hypothetical protein
MASSPTDGTAGYIIFEAMYEAGKRGKGQDPSPEDYALWMNRLNNMTRTWCTQGLKLFTWQDLTLPLILNKNLYTFKTGGDVNVPLPLRVRDAYYFYNFPSGDQRPLTPLSWDDWNRLSNKSQSSEPNSYFVDRQPDVLNFWVWLTPDIFTISGGTIHVVVQNQATKALQLTDATGFPPEWTLALIWGLADEKCTGAPSDVQTRCKERAGYYRQILEDFDVEEASTSFQPDARGLYATSRFS